jgi:hypothetical protein
VIVKSILQSIRMKTPRIFTQSSTAPVLAGSITARLTGPSARAASQAWDGGSPVNGK